MNVYSFSPYVSSSIYKANFPCIIGYSVILISQLASAASISRINRSGNHLPGKDLPPLPLVFSSKT